MSKLAAYLNHFLGRPGMRWLPWFTLLVTLGCSYWAWWVASQNAQREQGELFLMRAERFQQLMVRRLQAYEEVLRGVAGLMGVHAHTTRAEFSHYVESLALARNYPGIQGVGFSLAIPSEQLAAHTAEIRQQGFPQYAVWPQGMRDLYTSIIYLEPFAGRNLRAFGYDMHSEAIRCAAMDEACDTAKVTMSGKVKLVQETKVDVQAGFLMYISVYRSREAPASPEGRRASLLGWAYAPFRMNDLMANLDPEGLDDLHISIYDGRDEAEDSCLYKSDSVDGMRPKGLRRKVTLSLPQGRDWTLCFEPRNSAFHQEQSREADLIGLLLGTASFLVFTAMWYLINGHQRATELAKRMAEELGNSEERLNFVLKGSDIGIWELDLGTKKTVLSSRCSEMLGYPAESFEDQQGQFGNIVKDLLHPDEAAACVAAFWGHIKGETPAYSFEHRLRCQDGSYKWVHSRGNVTLRDGKGRALLYVGLLEDITVRKNAEETLSLAKRRLDMAISASRCGVWEWDVQSGHLFWDQRMLEIHGATADTFGERFDEWSNYLNPDDSTEFMRLIQSALGAAGTINREFRVITPLGESKVIQVYGTSWKENQARSMLVVGICMDITEAKRVVGQLVHARQQAEGANRAKNEFLAMMSHELRTPLNAVLGLSESLLDPDRVIPAEKSRRYLTIINDSGKRLLNVIDNVLDHARIEYGSLRPDYRPCLVAAAVESTLGIVQNQVTKKRLTLKCEPIDPQLTVQADERLLRQALFHLLNNAIKFTSEGGLIEVSAQRAEQGVEITVSDTGIGIAADKLTHLFKAFSQVDASISRPYEGVGLGLYLCDSIARLHGGYVKVASRVSVGSKFTLFVRFDPQQKEKLPEGQAPADRPITAGHILLVDDDPNHATLIGEYCANSEFTMEYVPNGGAALATLLKTKPSVVVLDLCMPDMDGFELIRRIRGRSATQNLPIVVLSALTMPSDQELAIETGANAFLEKPVNQQLFLSTLRRLI